MPRRHSALGPGQVAAVPPLGVVADQDRLPHRDHVAGSPCSACHAAALPAPPHCSAYSGDTPARSSARSYRSASASANDAPLAVVYCHGDLVPGRAECLGGLVDLPRLRGLVA